MEIVQTIELDDSERLALQKTLEIIDKISTITSVPIDSVFKYFTETASLRLSSEQKGNYEYNIKALHCFETIKQWWRRTR